MGVGPGPGSSWSVLIDVLLALVLLLSAVGGFRRGLVLSAASMGGFVLGAVLALGLLPPLERALSAVLSSGAGPVSGDRPVLRVGLGLCFVVVVAGLGQWLGARLGLLLRGEVRGRGSRAVDATLGGVCVVVATTLALWVVAGALRPVAPAPIAAALGRSAVLTGITSAMPAPVGDVVASLRAGLANHGMPEVFEGLTPEPIRSVGAPSEDVLAAPGVAAVEASVVRIDGSAPECQNEVEGTGWVLAPERVVTNAHVVAGTPERSVTDAAGVSRAAEVVLFDPDVDLAVLRVPGLQAPALVPGAPLSPGDDAVVVGFPLGGPYAVSPARVRGHLTARGRDIHGSVPVDRDVYSLRATVQPGNSGGPLVDRSGRVVGVVFARSLEDAGTAYALTLAQARPLLEQGRVASSPVGTGACLRS